MRKQWKSVNISYLDPKQSHTETIRSHSSYSSENKSNLFINCQS